MRVLIVGGSGRVATMVIPLLKQHHMLRVFDLRPPAHAGLTLDYVEGNVTDYDALAHATQGMNVLLYMAMGSVHWDTVEGINAAFDVNVKGLYLALKAVHAAGVTHAVYTSTMSVYDGALETRYFFSEDMPPDARNVYGFTKRLGEEVCRNAANTWDMSVNALRLCLPTPKEEWLAKTKSGVPAIATAHDDVARALLCALEYRNGFQAFMISGDYEQKIMNMAKARRLLNWEPLARPVSSG